MNIFRKNDPASRVAEERLKLILIQDRLLLSPQDFESLKKEILKVLSKYFDIEEASIKINLERTKEKSVFEAIVPVVSVKKGK
uniref:Cell division topological specificity factor n=1 Tax=Caldisericum exile TaxID=693075 RepID=A0A7C4Y038_9BACT